MNTALLRDWQAWLARAARWLAYGAPIKTPIRDRRERLAKVLAEGRCLAEQEGKMRA